MVSTRSSGARLVTGLDSPDRMLRPNKSTAKRLSPIVAHVEFSPKYFLTPRKTLVRTPGKRAREDDEIVDGERPSQRRQLLRAPGTPPPQTPSVETPSRSIFGTLGRAIESAKKLFTRNSPPEPSSPTSGTTNQASLSLMDETPDDTSTPLPINLFSGLPSYYGTPASEAHRLSTPMKKSSEQIEEQMRSEAEAVYKTVEDMGQADPEFVRKRRAAAAAKSETTIGQKRKLSAVDGMIPGPKNGGFGIDDSWLDQDNHVEGIGESLLDEEDTSETPQAKSQKTEKLQTPLKSALKKNDFAGLDSTLKRSARFNADPVASTRLLTGNYGPAGQYTGNIFADHEPTPSPASTISTTSESLSSLDSSDVFSPTTKMNTRSNAMASLEKHIAFDKEYRDPSQPEWRPSPANPRPGTFQVPDEEDFDDEEVSLQEDSASSAPPASPRPAHTALPTVSPAASTSVMPYDTSNSLADVSKINKAREQAEKFKPKESSRLSQVQQARSRSSSPPMSTEPEDHTPSLSSDNGEEEDDPEDHKFDDWAARLQWPAPTLKKDAGYTTEYMEDYVTRNWTEDDDEQSATFYEKEWKRLEEAVKEADQAKTEVTWV